MDRTTSVPVRTAIFFDVDWAEERQVNTSEADTHFCWQELWETMAEYQENTRV
jgi:hypothetical protein